MDCRNSLAPFVVIVKAANWLGQIGKIFGFSITKEGIIPRLTEFVSKLGLTHPPTLCNRLGCLCRAGRLSSADPALAGSARCNDRDRSGRKTPGLRRRGARNDDGARPPPESK